MLDSNNINSSSGSNFGLKSLKKWFKKAFIPHEENDHHPHFWRVKSLILIVLLVFIVEMALFAESFLVFKRDQYLAAILPGVLVSMTNEKRAISSESPLSTNDLLTKAAELKAKDMAERGYFSHNTPEGNLPWYWLQKVGYQYSHAGENLAVNFTDSKDVIDAWMNSPTHKANIIKNNYTEIGIAMAEGVYQGKNTIFVVQFFGTPLYTPAKTLQATKVVQSPRLSKENKTVTASTTSSSLSISKNASSSVATSSIKNEIATTSTTTIQNVAGAESDFVSFNFAESSPRNLTESILVIIFCLVAVALFLSFLTGFGKHHPKIVLIALFLMTLIIGAIMFNNANTKDNLKIISDSPLDY